MKASTDEHIVERGLIWSSYPEKEAIPPPRVGCYLQLLTYFMRFYPSAKSALTWVVNSFVDNLGGMFRAVYTTYMSTSPGFAKVFEGRKTKLHCRIHDIGTYGISWIRHQDALILSYKNYVYSAKNSMQLALRCWRCQVNSKSNKNYHVKLVNSRLFGHSDEIHWWHTYTIRFFQKHFKWKITSMELVLQCWPPSMNKKLTVICECQVNTEPITLIR